MNFKVHHLFMMLSIIPRKILCVETVDNEFNIFVKNLILNQFNASTYIGIFHNTKGIRDINLSQILESLCVPVILHDLITPRIIYNSSEALVPNQAMLLTNGNIIFIENSKQLRSILKVAVSNPFFSARTNMLVILTERVLGTEKWIGKVFSQLWQEYILNVGLVFHNGRINLLTYIPWTSPQKIQNLTDQGISANIFYDKLKNLRKYPIKILLHTHDSKMVAVTEKNTTTYFGIDGMTMSTILEHHNATSNIVILNPAEFASPCRFVHYNYTIQGLFGADAKNKSISVCPFSLRIPASWKRPSELDIIYYDIDVYFNSRPLRFDMDYRVDKTNFQRKDNICILIPAEHKIPQAVNLLLPLQEYIWLAIVLNFCLYTTIHFGIQTLNKNNKKSLLDTCLILYRIQMNSVAQDPKNSRALENASFLCWVLYSFLISAAYQSVLISFITVPFYAPPINRLEDLQKIDISISAYPDILADMPNAIDRRTSEIILPKIVLDLPGSPRKYDLNHGYLLQESEAEYIRHRKDFIDQNGRPLFHLMTECPMPLFSSYLMPRGSPLLQIIDKFTSRRRESGLEQVWQDIATRYLNSPMIRHIEYGEKRIRLTVAHLQGAFYILIIGEVGAICVFLLELFWNRIKRFSLSLPCNHSHIRSL